MTDRQLDERIIEYAGGKENLFSVAHCATRLRLIVNDRGRIDTEKI